MKHYDIIGDIHGCADQLEELLLAMGYQKKSRCYQHPERSVIYLGDFIDRGPKQKGTLDIVRPMIEEGAALSIMGNHEFNAICYATKKDEHSYVREHDGDKNDSQHAAFLEEYPIGSQNYRDAIAWFKTLPVFLDLGDLYIVHACWCQNSISLLSDRLNADNTLQDSAYLAYADKDSNEHSALEVLLKGPELPLPKALHFNDTDGHPREDARIRWWVDNELPTSERLEFGGADLNQTQLDALQKLELPPQSALPDRPVFFGHYWLKGKPAIQTNLAACVDYSVAKEGKLVAYRWSGEAELTDKNFFWI